MRGLPHVFAVGLIAGLASGGLAQAQAPELKKLHILMVFDTNAPELAKSLRVDKRRMLTLWRDTVPADRRQVTVLEDEKATKEKILDYYKNLQVGANEGLVFFYAGHGARDEKNGKHFFDLKKGSPLIREELTKAMEAKKAGLVLLLTDCCSTPQEFKDEKLFTDRGAGDAPAAKLHETVRCLLFRSRGTVDVTAATDNASWSDNLEGGIFTRSLCRTIKKPIKELDGNKDGFISWREFFPQLRVETQSLFGDWRRKMIARGEKVDERKQVPFAFTLGKVFAVVGILNATKNPLQYRCRWPGEEWTNVTLAPGEKKIHALPLTQAAGELPALETKFEFMAKPKPLSSLEYTGTAEPTKLTSLYRIRPR
jgi:hypothetical protein